MNMIQNDEFNITNIMNCILTKKFIEVMNSTKVTRTSSRTTIFKLKDRARFSLTVKKF